MTSVHVINADNRHAYADILERYYRSRYEVFINERGWHDLARADRRDVDCYDNEQATYLLALDGETPIGGLRLYPTVLPHMISDVFPHLAAWKGLLRGPTILECTRYFVVKQRRTGRVDCRLLAAFQEYCLEEGITEVTAVVEMWWLPRWQQIGFKVRPLGLPVPIEGQPCIAVAIEVSEESLLSVRKLAGLRDRSLLQHNDLHPILDRMPYAAA